MIDQPEIMELSREVGLRPDVVEKDYILGWVLGATYSHPKLQKDWIFKGGTCLKKCYFETYRFSEDLDFTLRNPDHLDQTFLNTIFGEIAGWIYDQSGIELPPDTISFEIYENPRGKSSVVIIWLYSSIRPRYGAGPKTAVIAGVIVWFLSALNDVAYSLSVFHLFPLKAVLIRSFSILVPFILAALAGAWVYKEQE